MSNPLFPPEIINNSAESYYSKLNISSRIIYLSVLFFITGIIILLPIIKVDISTQSRGVIRSPFENTIIQSPVYGEVVNFRLQENKQVYAGDTLVVLNTDRLNEQINLEIQKKIDNEAFMQDITSLLSKGSGLITPQYRSEYNRYLSKTKEQKIQLDYAKKELDTAQKLYDKKIISESEYSQQKNIWEREASLFNSIQEEFRTSWQNKLTQLEIENQQISSSIRQLEKDKRNYVLIAPVTGTLTQVAGFQRGNFIMPNQVIAYISASDSLLVECYISPLDIGYIAENQKVVFQIDAFDYRQWGMVEGYVSEVLQDVVMVSEKPVFRVRCKLNSSCLQLKTGYQGCIKKGMTLTGRFHLTKRTLWQLLFDKIDDWMNPKIIKEKE